MMVTRPATTAAESPRRSMLVGDDIAAQASGAPAACRRRSAYDRARLDGRAAGSTSVTGHRRRSSRWPIPQQVDPPVTRPGGAPIPPQDAAQTTRRRGRTTRPAPPRRPRRRTHPAGDRRATRARRSPVRPAADKRPVGCPSDNRVALGLRRCDPVSHVPQKRHRQSGPARRMGGRRHRAPRQHPLQDPRRRPRGSASPGGRREPVRRRRPRRVPPGGGAHARRHRAYVARGSLVSRRPRRAPCRLRRLRPLCAPLRCLRGRSDEAVGRPPRRPGTRRPRSPG
jgi:hypothetical protein